MTAFLILQLEGVMQAWGEHTFEDFRGTSHIPTRSALLGLLGACLGLDRDDTAQQQALDRSLYFTVRVSQQRLCNGQQCRPQRLTDFHTVEHARKVDIRKSNEFPVVSRREYLYDAHFHLAIEEAEQAVYRLPQLQQAVCKPVYTPYLGRRCCPLTKPLFAAYLTAENAIAALQQWQVNEGPCYSDAPTLQTDIQWQMRDQPLYGRIRQFANRRLFVHRPQGRKQ